MEQLALDLSNRAAVEEAPRPTLLEGDPVRISREIVRTIERSYYAFGGWGNSFETILDIIGHTIFDREDEYLDLVKTLDKEAISASAKVFGLLLEGLYYNVNPWDYLGYVYMELGSISKHQAFGQFFTPIPVTEAMAAMTLGDVGAAIETAKREGRRLTVNDPACGSGSMFLGAKRVILREAGIDGLEWFEFSGNDIDPICVKMARIQMRMTDYKLFGSWMVVKAYEATRQAPCPTP